MSGIDEQQHSIFPVCCRCGNTPRYWTLRNVEEEMVWFYSRTHSLSNVSSYKRGMILSYNDGERTPLEVFGSLKYVWCSDCKGTIRAGHSEEGNLFLEMVLNTAKEFIARGNYNEWD